MFFVKECRAADEAELNALICIVSEVQPALMPHKYLLAVRTTMALRTAEFSNIDGKFHVQW
jgi:hypothetical protein